MENPRSVTQFVIMAVMGDTELLGERVKAKRESVGLSLDVLYARITHLLPESMWGSTEMVRRLERGDLTRPNPFWVAAIAKALGCSVQDLSLEVADDLVTLIALGEEVSSPGASNEAKGRGRPSPGR